MWEAVVLKSSIVNDWGDTEGYSATENVEVFGQLGFV